MVRPLVLAHQGASARARGNTLESLTLARDVGADGVEVDVRRTADGVLVLHHDSEVGDFGLLASRTFGEVREALPYVPTLGEALAVVDGLLVNLELKCLPWEPDPDPDRVVVAEVVAQVRELGRRDSVVVSSFDLGAVDALRRLDPNFETAWLTAGQEVAGAAALAREHGHAWLHPDRGALVADPEAAVEGARRSGVRVDVWAVDDLDEIRAFAAAGVDAIITNVPDAALAALGSMS